MPGPKSFIEELLSQLNDPAAAARLCGIGSRDNGKQFTDSIEASNGFLVVLKGYDRGFGDWAEGEAIAYCRNEEDEDEQDSVGTAFSFYCKHFEEGSNYGIDNGRISKLEISLGTKDGFSRNLLINYDRGWDVNFDDFKKAYEAVYEAILKRFN